MSGYTALLADDVAELRVMTQLALERTGRVTVVGTATNGLEATDKARELQPDLVLLDISMPVQDGLEALPSILEVSPQTRVIMLSGFETERLGPIAMRIGATAYIEKGASPGELARIVLHALDRDEGPAEIILPELEKISDASEMERDELLSMIGHEFRQPLAVINGFGLTIEERWDRLSDEEKRHLVGRMTVNASYLDAVLTNVIQLRAGGPGQAQICVEDPAALVETLSEEVRMFTRENPVEVEIEPDLPKVYADAQRLRQVVTNLVVNATKFSPRGTPITLQARATDTGVALSVKDEGPGIPKERRTEMFGRFVKGDAKAKGLGLGLYISRQLMASMGGDLLIEDSEIGTTMTCLLKKADPAAP